MVKVNHDRLRAWAELFRNRIKDKRENRYLSFTGVLLILASFVAAQVTTLLVLPEYTRRASNRLRHAKEIVETTRPITNDIINLLPPITGRQYSIQLNAGSDQTAQNLFDRLLGKSDTTKLDGLRDVHDLDEMLPKLLELAFNGNAERNRLEEFLIRAVATEKIEVSPKVIHDALLANYFFPAQRSEFAGFIGDARRLYSRFLDLDRALASQTYLSGEHVVQRQLSRAQVRLKVLDARHSILANAFRTIQTAPVDDVARFLDDPDPSIRALAHHTAASLLWHAGDSKSARKVLEDLRPCDRLYDECEFLLAKILESDDQGIALIRLTQRLPDKHYLLDDVYLHRVRTAYDQNNKQLALQLLKIARQRCPNTDHTASFDIYEQVILEKDTEGENDERTPREP